LCFFKGLPSKRSPDTQLSNKPTHSKNHKANDLEFRKNSFNQQKIFFPEQQAAQLLQQQQLQNQFYQFQQIPSSPGGGATYIGIPGSIQPGTAFLTGGGVPGAFCQPGSFCYGGGVCVNGLCVCRPGYRPWAGRFFERLNVERASMPLDLFGFGDETFLVDISV
jgi:hypothetical protein